MEGQPDVVPDSSPAPEPQAPAQESPPAEALKTDEPGPVPYERFKEVNEQLRSLKESKDWSAYQQLKTTMETDPRFAEHFVSTIQGYFAPKPQEPVKDPYADYPQEIAEPLRKTQVLEQTVQQLLEANQYQQKQAVYSQYTSTLNEKMAAAKVPDHWKDFYRENAERIAAQINPNALAYFDPSLIEKAFEAVDQRAKAIQRAERGSYVVDKKNDITPASTSATGSAGQQVSRPQTFEERHSLVTELIRAAQN